MILPHYSQEYAHKFQFYHQFINRDDLYLDIGGNIGTKTEVFLALDAVVVASQEQQTVGVMPWCCIWATDLRFSNIAATVDCTEFRCFPVRSPNS